MTSANARARARIGVLVPFTNTNLEADLACLQPEGVSFHYARLGGYDIEAVPDAEQMAGLGAASLEEPLRLIAGVRPDAILYGCTSATLTHGLAFDRDLSARAQAQTGAVTVTAASALVHALQTLGTRRIGFASPYVRAINAQAEAFLREAGFQTVRRVDVDGELDNYGQGELTPGEVFELGRQADHPDAEAIVLSCTDMRSVEVIEQLETETGKPVISSNQAMLFSVLHALGLGNGNVRCGSLFNAAGSFDRQRQVLGA